MSDFDLPLPFSDAYWVVPGLFLAGEYPGVYDELVTRHRIQSLIRLGITNYIDLTHPDDYVRGYEEILQDEANGYMKKVHYFRESISDRSVPSIAQMTRILDRLETCIKEKKPVYVHCIAGIGRTGTVVGCYLARQGVAADDLVDEIKTLRLRTSCYWARSPEADIQVDFIKAWKS